MTTSVDPHGLTTTVDGTEHLVGSVCTSCATHAFPVQDACPRCGAAMTPSALPTVGTLWTWTVQRIRPKPPYDGPEEFEPYAVGYVDLGPLRVEGRLEGRAPDEWTIGTPMRLAPRTPADPDGHGDIWRYRFVEDRS
jgi:uncharacterized OB-fold protein